MAAPYKNVDAWLLEWKEGTSTPPPPYSNAELEALAIIVNENGQTALQEAKARHHGQFQWVWDRAAKIQQAQFGPPPPEVDALALYLAAQKNGGKDSEGFEFAPWMLVAAAVVAYMMFKKK